MLGWQQRKTVGACVEQVGSGSEWKKHSLPSGADVMEPGRRAAPQVRRLVYAQRSLPLTCSMLSAPCNCCNWGLNHCYQLWLGSNASSGYHVDTGRHTLELRGSPSPGV